MKIKDGYMLREVAGSSIIVGVGAESIDFNGIININETGAFIWNQMAEDTTSDKVAEALVAEYEIDKETALRDVNAFIEKLTEAGLIAE